VEARRLFLERGFSSLFTYCTGVLGYSESEAMLRIQAMRLVRKVPEVESKIEKGELSLTVAAMVQGASSREKLPLAQTKELVEEVAGSSKREAEEKLATLFPETVKAERVRPVSEERGEIRFTVTREEAELFERLLDRKAHANFQRKYELLFVALAKAEMKKLEGKEANSKEPEEKQESNLSPPLPEMAQRNSQVPKATPRTRHIPHALQKHIWRRDQARCQYKDLQTTRLCHEKHGIQIDHKIHFSAGGPHSEENLRLLCGAHNRWRSSS
jgi:hypothetical protein